MALVYISVRSRTCLSTSHRGISVICQIDSDAVSADRGQSCFVRSARMHRETGSAGDFLVRQGPHREKKFCCFVAV